MTISRLICLAAIVLSLNSCTLFKSKEYKVLEVMNIDLIMNKSYQNYEAYIIQNGLDFRVLDSHILSSESNFKVSSFLLHDSTMTFYVEVIFVKGVSKAFNIDASPREGLAIDSSSFHGFITEKLITPLRTMNNISVFYEAFNGHIDPILVVDKDINHYQIEEKVFLEKGLLF